MRGIGRLMCTVAATAAMLGLATGQAGAAPLTAPSTKGGVTEFQLATKRVGPLAAAPDGTVLYKSTLGTWEHPESRLGRIGASGPLGEESAPQLSYGGLVAGTEGDAWAVTIDPQSQSWVGRKTAAGWSEIAGTHGAYTVAPSAKGGVWFLQSEPTESNRTADELSKVGYVGPDGGVTSFLLSNHEAGYQSVVEGREGNAWFTELFTSAIGRMTPSGELKEFPLAPNSRPVGIAADAEGNIWFTETEANRIGRLTPAGELTEFTLPKQVSPNQIAVGGDGRIWFTESVRWSETEPIGNLGRITPAGRFTQVELPDRESEPVDLTTGPEGNVWYSAMGEIGCLGGGSSCLVWEPKNAAIVGRVAGTPLKPLAASATATVGSRGVKVAVACTGGTASSRCQGKVTVKIGGKAIGRAGYSLEADQAKQIVVPPLRGITSPLRGRAKRAALVTLRDLPGEGSRAALTLTRAAKKH
jgi:streptogramin lyase